MTPDDVHSYLGQFHDSNWSQMTVTDGTGSLYVSRALQSRGSAVAAPARPADRPGTPDPAPPVVVRSPSVGLLRLSRRSGAAPDPGDRVTAGSWLADLIVADRTDPVVSPVNGTLTRRMAADGDAVEYDQALVVIQP